MREAQREALFAERAKLLPVGHVADADEVRLLSLVPLPLTDSWSACRSISLRDGERRKLDFISLLTLLGFRNVGT
jgi:hypothetical protein